MGINTEILRATLHRKDFLCYNLNVNLLFIAESGFVQGSNALIFYLHLVAKYKPLYCLLADLEVP